MIEKNNILMLETLCHAHLNFNSNFERQGQLFLLLVSLRIGKDHPNPYCKFGSDILIYFDHSSMYLSKYYSYDWSFLMIDFMLIIHVMLDIYLFMIISPFYLYIFLSP